MTDRYRPMSFSIDTERLYLRLRDREDAACNLELLGEHDGGTNLTLVEAERHLAEQKVEAHESGFGFLGIRRRDDGEVIGYCGLLVGRGSFDEPEIAYELLRHARGQGYATEAARAVLASAFATGRRRVWSTVRARNEASLRVLDKLGFRRDHTVTDEHGDLVYLARDA